MHVKAAVLLLSLVILISGCTTGGTGGGAGVVIESFEPDFTSVFSGEQVTFHIKLKNTGSVSSGQGKVLLLGLEEWQTGTSAGTDCPLNPLLAPEPAFGTSGQTQICEITRKAPVVPQGIPVTYQATARVTYGYGSSFVKTINIGSQEELRRIQTGGGALPSETTSASTSPIALNVVNKGPIRVFESSVKFPLEITVTNVGGGVVCKDNNCDTPANWNNLRIRTRVGGQEESECSRDLTLFRGQSNTITCSVEIQKPQSGGIIQKTIEVTSSYSYFYDSTIPIKVNPIPTSG